MSCFNDLEKQRLKTILESEGGTYKEHFEAWQTTHCVIKNSKTDDKYANKICKSQTTKLVVSSAWILQSFEKKTLLARRKVYNGAFI
jgi:hypothetical protein